MIAIVDLTTGDLHTVPDETRAYPCRTFAPMDASILVPPDCDGVVTVAELAPADASADPVFAFVESDEHDPSAPGFVIWWGSQILPAAQK